MRLRPYQSDLVSQVGAALHQHRSVLLQLPTGGGKTHIAAHVAGVAAAVGERVWIVAHRREIVGQTSRSMAELGVPHGVVGAGQPFEPAQAVQVCAIGTLARRAEALPAPDLMIWDEAHHVAAKSWAALRSRFPDARHLGLTATPERLDGKGLAEFFAHLICGPSTAELMAAGHLSPYRLFAPTIPDLRGVGLRAGDYARDQLAERMSGATLVGDAVEHYRRHAPDARAVAFCVTVEASRALAAKFNAASIPAAHVGGDTPEAERDAAIAALATGQLRVLTNVEVFTEGFDLPAIDAVILLRPTRSLALHRQMVGRGLRAAPGKRATVILDHAGLFYDHGLPDEPVAWTLDRPGRRRGPLGAERLRRCPECSDVHPMAMECPECGYVYSVADRTIRELLGNLREVVPQEGFDTIGAFARRIGRAPSSINQLTKRGLPRSPTGLIPIAEALSWLENGPVRPWHGAPPLGASPDAYETQHAFAARIGKSLKYVRLRVRQGMPVAKNGWIHVAPALVWLAERRPTGESPLEFSARIGVSPAQVRSAKRRGLPLEPDGSIAIDAALQWMSTRHRPLKLQPAPGYEPLRAFADRCGIERVSSLRRRGLPIEPNGLVHVETGLAWIAEHGAQARR